MKRGERCPPSRASAGEPLAERMLFDAVLALVAKALDRHHFSNADRQDIAQDVAIAAFRRHSTYRPDRGTPGQWLSGVVRREVKRFLRVQSKQPWFAAGDDLPEPVATSNPEDEIVRHYLTEHVFSMLPPASRRVVLLVELEGLTFREAATREHISPSTAYERHQRGMAALRDAAERPEELDLDGTFSAWLGLLTHRAEVGSRGTEGGMSESGTSPSDTERNIRPPSGPLGLGRPDPRRPGLTRSVDAGLRTAR
jgi:RNA polymerase sigma factor (sigma-70 family)